MGNKSEKGVKRQRETSKKRVSFKKRKECILKKTMELAVLCDIQACAVIMDDSGEIATWPENRDEVMKVLKKYREVRVQRRSDINSNGGDGGHGKETVPVVTTAPTTTTGLMSSSDDPLEWDQKVLENLLKEPWGEILNEVGVGDNGGGDFKNVHDYQSLLREVDAKLKALTERIEVLKSAGDSQSNYLYQQLPIASPDVSYSYEGFSNQQSNFYIPDEVIVGGEMDSANFNFLMETNEFMKSAEGYESIQIPVAYFMGYNQDEGGSSSNDSTQMPIASPDMPYLFDQEFLNHQFCSTKQMPIDSPDMPYLFDQGFLNHQFCSTNWNMENCFRSRI